MSIIINEVRTGTYLDSVALMRLAREIRTLPDIEEAGLMIGTPANRAILGEAGVLGPEGEQAGPGDLIVAVRAASRAAAEAAIAKAREMLDARRDRGAGAPDAWQPRSLRAAHEALPDASLALISVPGPFAAAEAFKALRRGLNVMIFSDNVPLAEELALKLEARERGLLVMGPDCGTAIIAGLPLGFANVVPRGDIGIVGASGTGIQEVSCLLARAGHGVSHALGTGGRDLGAGVGGITTLMAIDLLEADPATRRIVLISKPPAAEVARRIADRIAGSPKPFTVCFLGAREVALPANAATVTTLEDAALSAAGAPPAVAPAASLPAPPNGGRLVRGLFAGGTLCAEAQVLALEAGHAVASNVPLPRARALDAGDRGHQLIDLGDDAYTRGRPHPMIEPGVRDAPLQAALSDGAVGVVLLDVVLGRGTHGDPGGHLARLLAGRRSPGPLVVASVTGADGDPQGLAAQIRSLAEAGVIVAPSNAAAARLAFAAVARPGAA